MCDYPFFIPQVVLFANSSLFWFKVTNEHREFRNYLISVFTAQNILYPDTLWKRYSIYTIQYLASTYKSTANQNPCDHHIFITVFYSIAISRQEVKIIYKSVKILKAFFSKSIYNVSRICCGAISAPQQSIKLKHKNL